VTYDPPGTSTLEFKVNQFYFPCRFDTDELDVELLFHYINASSEEKAHGQIADVPLIEVRV
jgi:hypothetical protein